MMGRVQDEHSQNVRPERQLGYLLIIDPLVWESPHPGALLNLA